MPGRRCHLAALGLVIGGCNATPPAVAPDEPAPIAAEQRVSLLDEVWTEGRREQLTAALASIPGEWPSICRAAIESRVQSGRATWAANYERARNDDDIAGQRCLEAEVWELSAVAGLIIEKPERAAQMWSEIARLFDERPGCLGRHDLGYEAPPLPPSIGEKLARARLLAGMLEPEAAAVVLNELAKVPVVQEEPNYHFHYYLLRSYIILISGAPDEEGLQYIRSIADNPRALATVAQLEAMDVSRSGDLERTLTLFETSVQLAREYDDPWAVVTGLHWVASVRILVEDFEGAEAAASEGLALATELGGSNDPHTCRALGMLGVVEFRLGHVDRARELMTESRDRYIVSLGSDHPETLSSVALIEQMQAMALGGAD